MYPQNLHKIKASFSRQADRFEASDMSFPKKVICAILLSCFRSSQVIPFWRSPPALASVHGHWRHMSAQVTCLDATAEMLEIGRAEAARQGLSNLSFLEGYAEQRPLPTRALTL